MDCNGDLVNDEDSVVMDDCRRGPLRRALEWRVNVKREMRCEQGRDRRKAGLIVSLLSRV
jgi:hypothetical protein